MNPSLSTLPKPASFRFEQACVALLALTVATVPLFFYTHTQDQFELPKLVLLRVLSSLLLSCAAAYWVLKPGQVWRRTPLDLPLALFSLWLIVKTIHSVSPALSWRGEYENFAGSLTQLNYSLLFWLSTQFITTWARARILAQAILWAAMATSLYALLQASQRDFINWASESYISNRFFGTLGNPNFLAGLACMAIVLKAALAWEEQVKPLPEKDADRWSPRLLGITLLLVYLLMEKLSRLFFLGARPGQDQAALVIVLTWAASHLLSFILRKLGHRRTALAIGQCADLLVLLKALANTGTRGGFLGLLGGLGLLSFGWAVWRAQGQSWRPLVMRLALGLTASTLVLGFAFMRLSPSFSERVGQTLSDPVKALDTSRMQIWVPAIKIWKDHPITGTGVDTFKSVFPSYATSRFNRYDGDNVSSRMAHCEPLQILATMGVVGLGLWSLLCAALVWAWWKRLRAAGDEAYLLMGLGAFLAAYLTQNLVSFGVSGISVPFFVAAALLFAGDRPAPSATPDRKSAFWPALLVAAIVAIVGIRLATSTLTADKAYALSFQVHRQMQGSENFSAQEASGMAGYGAQELQSQRAKLPPEFAAELDQWLPLLYSASRQVQERPEQAESVRASLIQGGAALLYTLSALKMEQAVALCPGEVKYQVYLGLAYEELFKRTLPARREVWFVKARQAYEKSTALNPQNAYYQGNLGRLLGMAAEAGAADYFEPAEKHYLAAIRIAPVTRLFYENVVLLYARYGKLKEAAALMDSLEARDKELAPALLVATASTFYQWRQQPSPHWNAELKKASLPQAILWTRRALALAPAKFLDPRDQAAYGDYALTLAVFELAAGDRMEAKMALAMALEWKPKDPEILNFKKQYNL